MQQKCKPLIYIAQSLRKIYIFNIFWDMFQSCCNRKKIITLSCVCVHGKQLAGKEAESLVSTCSEWMCDKNTFPQNPPFEMTLSVSLGKSHSSAFNSIIVLKYSTTLRITSPKQLIPLVIYEGKVQVHSHCVFKVSHGTN